MRIWKVTNCQKCNKPLLVLLRADAEYTADEKAFEKLKKLEWCECVYPG
jgi:hypothetical protein